MRLRRQVFASAWAVKGPLQKAAEVIIKSFLRMTWVSLLGRDSKSVLRWTFEAQSMV